MGNTCAFTIAKQFVLHLSLHIHAFPKHSFFGDCNFLHFLSLPESKYFLKPPKAIF